MKTTGYRRAFAALDRGAAAPRRTANPVVVRRRLTADFRALEAVQSEAKRQFGSARRAGADEQFGAR